jgi:hypothetical protein
MIDARLAARVTICCIVGVMLCGSPALAGNEANFVLYDHHTEKQGTREINVLTDFSGGAPDEPSYAAQLIEIEAAITDQWMAALYFEGDKIDGSEEAFGGWRLESRYRLFPYGVFLNPVLYVEYGDLQSAHRYLLEVVGRNDAPEGEAGRELESRLILGQDLGENFDVAFNWINDVNLSSGNWEFGYAMGLNYTVFVRPDASAGGHGGFAADNWELKEVKLGAELYGGLGDSDLGLTLDPQLTQHYAGLNLRGEFENGLHAQVGAAVGLTDDSERALVRLMFGYEFE